MPAITLPDGSVRSYDQPVTPAQVAADIGPGLAKAAFVAKVDGKFVDLGRPNGIRDQPDLRKKVAATRRGRSKNQRGRRVLLGCRSRGHGKRPYLYRNVMRPLVKS